MTRRTAVRHTCARCRGLSRYLEKTLITFPNEKGNTRKEHWVHPYFGSCFRSLKDDQEKLLKRVRKLEDILSESSRDTRDSDTGSGGSDGPDSDGAEV